MSLFTMFFMYGVNYDQNLCVQEIFVAVTKALVAGFQEAGNPFDEDSDEIIILVKKRYCQRRSPKEFEVIYFKGNGIWELRC